MIDYAEKLLDPRWQRRRLEILSRDDWKCVHCGDREKTLHVHHYWYEPGKEPWEHCDESMATLCCDCHDLETENSREIEQDLIHVLRAKRMSCCDLVNLMDVFSDAKLIDGWFDNWREMIQSMAWLVRGPGGHAALKRLLEWRNDLARKKVENDHQ